MCTSISVIHTYLLFLKRTQSDHYPKQVDLNDYFYLLKLKTMKKILLLTLSLMSLTTMAQNTLTPELLWKLGRVTPLGLSKDGKNVIYKVGTPSVAENKSSSKLYSLSIEGGNATEIKDTKESAKLTKTRHLTENI